MMQIGKLGTINGVNGMVIECVCGDNHHTKMLRCIDREGKIYRWDAYNDKFGRLRFHSRREKFISVRASLIEAIRCIEQAGVVFHKWNKFFSADARAQLKS